MATEPEPKTYRGCAAFALAPGLTDRCGACGFSLADHAESATPTEPACEFCKTPTTRRVWVLIAGRALPDTPVCEKCDTCDDCGKVAQRIAIDNEHGSFLVNMCACADEPGLWIAKV